jgi:hypothetical protein
VCLDGHLKISAIGITINNRIYVLIRYCTTILLLITQPSINHQRLTAHSPHHTSSSHRSTTTMSKEPVIIVQDNRDDAPKKKRARTEKKKGAPSNSILRPESSNLLDDMLYPLTTDCFLKNHFRKDAVCINRKHNKQAGNEEMVSYICDTFLFGLNVKEIFAETSSENVFLWLRPPPSKSDTKTALHSVEISDPASAFALHQSGSHPAYCRAPPALEQLLVGSLLRATGLGAGHYHPPHADVVTIGGGTTLGRGEVELFISTSSSSSKSKDNGSTKKHLTGWHTDFQENFTIQLSGVKKWTLRRGRVRHPLRGTTPHYAREASVIENQLKVARLSSMSGTGGDSDIENNPYGFEYGENNAYGSEMTLTLYPGDCLYFPSGMWHKVETIEPGVSLNVSLMGTTYAKLMSEALHHLLIGSDEGWREIVTSRPGEEDATKHLESLMSRLPEVITDFVKNRGGAQSVLPPALQYPPIGNEENDGSEKSVGETSEDGKSMGSEGEEKCAPSDEEEEGQSDDDNSEDDDTPTSSIIIPMDHFVGPPGWSCIKPPNTKLAKNPLATLIAMQEITQHLDTATGAMDATSSSSSSSKKYILNVNFAGNDMYESHIRVILETEKYGPMMDWYLAREAKGGFDGGDEIDLASHHPPPCLFYYGYLSWVNI